ncbi:MAG TPA: porin family protein [Ohtaekwangia sp.]
MNRILLLIIILSPCLSHAQIWYIGGKAGATFSNYKAKTPWNEVTNMGYTAGLAFYKQTKNNWGINVEIQYTQKGYNHKVCEGISDQLEATYIEVPFMIDYGFIFPSMENLKLHVNLGCYAAYWMTAEYKLEGYSEPDEAFDFKKSNASRFDFGPNAGMRLEYIFKNSSLSLDARYELGIIDLQKQVDDNTANTNRTLIVGLSYLKILGDRRRRY